jgi:hypothetical protein
MPLLLDSTHLSSRTCCLTPGAGTLMVKSASVVPRPSFLDYIAGAPAALGISTCCPAHPDQLSRDVLCFPRMFALLAEAACLCSYSGRPHTGGVELNFLVAVDYTASNRDPRDPASLHFISQRPTIYEGRCVCGV